MRNNPPRPAAELTVFYDGACPLCRAEIDMYHAQDTANVLNLVDVSTPDAPIPEGLDRETAMARFHLIAADGRMLSGAAAFVEIWRHMPGWRWAAQLASLPGVLAVLEAAYRLFLWARPAFVRLFVAVRQPRKPS